MIKQIQNIDPLRIAESITGQSYKENNVTALLGLSLQMQKSKLMNELLDNSNDTKFSETTTEYLRKAKDFGFEIVFTQEFDGLGWGNKPIKECFYILWHKNYSILLAFDTFCGNRNGGKFYYNWSPKDVYSRHFFTSSGCFEGFHWKPDFSEQLINPEPEPRWNYESQSWEEFSLLYKEWSLRNKQYIEQNGLKAIWVGDHDCREALKNNINLMAQNGVFLKKWKKKPFLWLLHHGDTDTKGYDYEQINKERLNLLPDYVKQCIV